MKKYLKNGQEVEVIKEIEGGYLYQHCYYDDYSDEMWNNEEVTYFAENLYDSPPVEKLHKEVSELQKEIDILQVERAEIRKLKDTEKGLLTEIKKRDFVQGLINYLNGDFEYVLYEEDMELIEKNKVYISPYIKITNTKRGGFSLYKLRSEDYDSYDDRAIMVFKTVDEAKEYAKKVLINRLKDGTEKGSYKWGTNVIKKWYDGIHRSIHLKDDDDIKKIYQEKYSEAENKEKEEKKLKLQNEIKEKEKLLNNIS